MRDPLASAESALRKFALGFPESTEDFPWGERSLKVRGKVFVFLSRHDGVLRVTTKLPVSSATALELPFAEPTGYGLGQHGWVTATFEPEADNIPLDLIREWIDESYRAVAPRSVLAKLEEKERNPRPRPKTRAK